jgi:SAM-dependent methyltransferase
MTRVAKATGVAKATQVAGATRAAGATRVAKAPARRVGWDHPATAEWYERFCRRHLRYRRANDVLVREAAIVPGMRLLDFGAGTGRTASAALPLLGRNGTIVCVEPSGAMRAAGRRRLRDLRVTWRPELPNVLEERASFDRVIAGAVIWQLDSLDDWIRRVTALLRPGGALVFDVPALYLGEPDEPGGGRDPLLLDLMTSLVSARATSAREPGRDLSDPPLASVWRHCREDVDAVLDRSRLRYRSWEFRHRFTQTAYASWLSIPVLTDGLLPGVDAAERVRCIERALATVDVRSFKWERWRGWTAWKS